MKPEKPKIYEKLYRKKTLVLKEKYCKYCEQFLMDTLANISQNIFAYTFVSEHSKHFFLFREKKNFFSVGGPT